MTNEVTKRIECFDPICLFSKVDLKVEGVPGEMPEYGLFSVVRLVEGYNYFEVPCLYKPFFFCI